MNLQDLTENLYYVTLIPETELTNMSINLFSADINHEVQMSLSDQEQALLIRNMKRILSMFHKKGIHYADAD